MKRRNLIKVVPLLAGIPVFNACVGVSMGKGLSPRYLIPREVLLSELMKHFPYEQSLAGVGMLKATSPTLKLLPDKNKLRVSAILEASLGGGVAGMLGIPALAGAFTGKPKRGFCQLACGLSYNPKTRGVYLKDPEIEQLHIQDSPAMMATQIRSMINKFGGGAVDRFPIHTLDKSFKARVLRDITVADRGVYLSFGFL